MSNKVQLITYVDRLSGGGIAALAAMLAGPLRGLFGGLHLLPFYDPIDGADAGFDPSDHTRVDPRLGGWEDIGRLGQDFELMSDLIVNHISSASPQFQDYLQKGRASAHAGMFLTRQAVFGQAPDEMAPEAIYRPRPGLPFTRITLADGTVQDIWTTFTPDQIDIDVEHPLGQAYLDGILHRFAAHGVRMVRLDAIGYAVKKPGTTCFMLPETFEYIARLSARIRELGMQALVEIHSHYLKQIEIAQHVDWVYDFALPPLLLHAFSFRSASALKRWLRLRPTNAVTVLDTHDGIGIIDIGADREHPGIVADSELERLVERIHENTAGQSRKATGSAASNLDIYQVNCTYYDALGRDDRHYLLARAIQFFIPGIPQVYYVGLLAGENDMELLARTGVGRDINRHYYSAAELRQALRKPVVRGLCDLIRLRNTHPAFAGEFDMPDEGEDKVVLRWRNGLHQALLMVDFSDDSHLLCMSDGRNGMREVDLLPAFDVRA